MKERKLMDKMPGKARKGKHVWEDVIDNEIRRIAGNYETRAGFRERPALLCIDNYNAVFGDGPDPLLKAMKRFPSSCGPAAWDAVKPTKRLMAAARAAGIPVIHTTRDGLSSSARSRLSSTKRISRGSDSAGNHDFFPELTPADDELVIRKTRASAFFGTPLIAHLTQMEVNQLIVCGNSTSGCVRATTVDGFMHGFRVAVVEECVFDRNRLSHKVNLFDMNSKYADVVFLDEALAFLKKFRRISRI
jgi:maleamate amidohydrolase